MHKRSLPFTLRKKSRSEWDYTSLFYSVKQKVISKFSDTKYIVYKRLMELQWIIKWKKIELAVN